MKLYRELATSDKETPYIAHYCPGCKEMHRFAVDQPQRNGAKWSFDGNVEQPTFNPSMNIRIGPFPAREHHSEPPEGGYLVCHYFLHAGILKYLNDCTHELKGQEVPLPDIPDRHTIYLRIHPDRYAAME